ncbi:MAG: hypothetical protein M8861_05265 [marine benthic group bacterium]|nr:hypothetical protein [Gemmatimonadota bacterium]
MLTDGPLLLEPALQLVQPVQSDDRVPGGLEFINEYSDFREVNGVLFAFMEVTYAQGQHTADVTLEEVKTYDVLPAEHFDPDPSAASS